MTRHIVFFMLLSMLAVAACDTTQHLDEVDEAELEVVTAVVAEAMAGQTEGFMSDVYDLTADISASGMQHRSAATAKTGQDPLLRGGPRNFSAAYDPATGTHTVSFSRSMEMPHWSKSMEAVLKYIYRDVDGNFLQFPRRTQDLIASITFDGWRSGHTYRETPRGDQSMRTEFERSTQWYLSGLDAGASHLTLEGEQSHTGLVHRIGLQDREMHREFSLRMRTVDVTIGKDADGANLGELVTGTIEYEVNIAMTVNGREQVRSHAGTIELAGDGSALLRFEGLRQVFRINLKDGGVQRTR